MGGGKGGYSGPSAPALVLTAEQKRKQEIVAARNELKYLEDRSRQLCKDADDILQQLPNRDYDKFKTLSQKDKDSLLQQLRTVDYNRFQRLQDEEEKVEKQIQTASTELTRLEEKDGRKKNTSKRR